MSLWRLIDTGPCSGVENMAIDEALLHNFDPTESRPVLRLYGWEPASLSLGRFQNVAEELDLEHISAAAVPIVRRITGGGAIYHADELTYSIVCSPDQIQHTSTIKDTFRVLTSFLLDFYRQLGLPADYAADCAMPDERLGGRTPFCFAGKESFDILVNGRKIGGNAQRRLKQVIFQHGSIPLKGHLEAGLRCLKNSPESLELKVTDLCTEGVLLPVEQLKQQLVNCFAGQQSQRDLLPETLTDKEQVSATALLQGKYMTDCWNLRGEQLADR